MTITLKPEKSQTRRMTARCKGICGTQHQYCVRYITLQPTRILRFNSRVYAEARHLAGEYVEQIVDCELGHLKPSRVTRAADMRRDYDVGQREQRVVHCDRLALGYVETSTRKMARRKRVEQRLLIEYRAARRIDDCRSAFHRGELARADHVMRRRSERYMNRDEVRYGEQACKIGVIGASRRVRSIRRALRIARRVEDAHTESRASSRDRAPDRAPSDDPQRRAIDVLAEHYRGCPCAPSSVAHEAVALRHTAGSRHQERERQIGSRLGENSRRMPDRDTGARRSRQIDIVDADGEIADHQKTRRTRDRFGVEAVAHHAQDAVDFVQAGDEFVVRGRHLVGPDLDLCRGAQPLEGRFGDHARNEDTFLMGGIRRHRYSQRRRSKPRPETL